MKKSYENMNKFIAKALTKISALTVRAFFIASLIYNF